MSLAPIYLPSGYKHRSVRRDVSSEEAKAVETEHWSGRVDVAIRPHQIRVTVGRAPDGMSTDYAIDFGAGHRLLIPREAWEEFRRRYA